VLRQVGPTSADTVPGHNAQRIVVGDYLYIRFSFQPQGESTPFSFSPAHPAMPLAVRGSHFTTFDELSISHRRKLYRRSSCPSIPRSVSACSSIGAIDLGSEDPRILTDCGDVDTYMSPLFRGLGEIGEEHGETATAKRVSPTSTRGFTSRMETVDYDDSLSESLSNYQFDFTGHVHVPEPSEASESNLSTEQPSTPEHPCPPMVPDKTLKPKASQTLPPPRDSSPSPHHFLPSAPPEATRPIIPLNTGTTRPLQIDRLRKHTGLSVTSQRTTRTDAQNVPPPSRSIPRATTQVSLRNAYKRDGERKVPTRDARSVLSSYSHPHAKTPDQNITQVNL
jgi:hypothetical protein